MKRNPNEYDWLIERADKEYVKGNRFLASELMRLAESIYNKTYNKYANKFLVT